MIEDLKVNSAAVTDRGLSDKRPQNEDAYLEMPELGLFAVADGVGGAQAGDVASQMAMEMLGEAFANRPPGSDPEHVMRAALEEANSAIYRMSRQVPQLSTMATTVVAMHVQGNIATIAHVGDSRLYRLDPNGELFQETNDHSVVAEEVRAGRMSPEQAESHPSRNVISRALGAEADVDVELRTIMFEPGSSFLLCTDGITRHIVSGELKGALTFGGRPDEICGYLKSLCFERGAEDNLTAVVVKTGSGQSVEPRGIGPDASYAAQPEPLTASLDEGTAATARLKPIVPALNADDDEDLLEIAPVSRSPFDQRVTDEPSDEDAELDLLFPTASDERVRDGDRALKIEEEKVAEAAPSSEVAPSHAVEADQADFQKATLASDPVSRDPEEDSNAGAAATSATPPENSPIETVAPLPQPQDDRFTMFGTDVGDDGPTEKKRSALAGVLSGLLFLALGIGAGMAAYHFFVLPRIQVVAPAPVEMRTGNIPLTSFEENRRTVDADPAAAVSRFGVDPQDAEDHYLVGRANLLMGNYPQAKAAFFTAKERISSGDVDKANVKVIESDIAVAMAALNDSTVQGALKQYLSGSPANSVPPNTNAR